MTYDPLKAMIEAAGPYKKWALSARKEYINLRMRQDFEIRQVYINAMDRVAEQLKKVSNPNNEARLKQLYKQLSKEAELLAGDLTSAVEQHIQAAVAAGSGYSQSVTTQLLKNSSIETASLKEVFSKVNAKAVEACWARTHKGMKLSDRIWQQSEGFRKTVQSIVQESVVLGQNATTTAKLLETYVREDARTLTGQYPAMMERMAGRIPGNISYEAMRLARTESTSAFGEGTILGGQASPSYGGVKWVLSKSHPVYDICDKLAGVYKKGEEPHYPGHPNCLCILVPVHEDPQDFVNRLKRWEKNSRSEPGLEDWYRNIFLRGAA